MAAYEGALARSVPRKPTSVQSVRRAGLSMLPSRNITLLAIPRQRTAASGFAERRDTPVDTYFRPPPGYIVILQPLDEFVVGLGLGIVKGGMCYLRIERCDEFIARAESLPASFAHASDYPDSLGGLG